MKKTKQIKKNEPVQQVVEETLENKIKRVENEINKILVMNDVKIQPVLDYKIAIFPNNQ